VCNLAACCMQYQQTTMFKNCPQAKVNINIECEHGLTSLAEHAAPRIAQR